MANEMYSMGACVIVASRTLSRCEDSVAIMKKTNPRSQGELHAMQLDLSDFDNVRAFAKKFNAKFPKLHFLVNNAGIHYLSAPGRPMFDTSIKCESKQGFDLSFASNYMGHWLLVQLLLPKLTETGKDENVAARVVNISSAYHLSVNGGMLQTNTVPVPVPAGGYSDSHSDSTVHASAPLAARMDINTLRHRRRSYGNSKLAQILFTHELDRRLKAEDNYDVEVVSVCPGWVSGTHIAPPGPVGKIITFFGCELNRGCFGRLLSIIVLICRLYILYIHYIYTIYTLYILYTLLYIHLSPI